MRVDENMLIADCLIGQTLEVNDVVQFAILGMSGSYVRIGVHACKNPIVAKLDFAEILKRDVELRF